MSKRVKLFRSHRSGTEFVRADGTKCQVGEYVEVDEKVAEVLMTRAYVDEKTWAELNSPTEAEAKVEEPPKPVRRAPASESKKDPEKGGAS